MISPESALAKALAGEDVNLIWDEFESQKTSYEPVMDWLPTTLPKSKSNETINIDFNLHNLGIVLRALSDIAPDFREKIKCESKVFNPMAFPGAYLRAAYIYYRYILKGMRPERSDTPDIHQIFYFQYCSKVILEKSMAGILHQLKNERGLIGNLEIQSIRHIRSIVN
jgi:hypothetical protein